MITAIHRSLAAKRAALKNDDKGFTLIELLVVILIIGILTAIAVPVFLGQQNQAKDAAAKSDLGVAKVAYVSYETANNGVAPTTALQLGTYGYVSSDGVTAFTISTTIPVGATFCLQATSAVPNTFHITDIKGVESGACA
ncbi:MAG: prepilin-type N-terminal cleavage/methylation domain-containing protein [Pseudolysinimonas sp.]